MMKPFLFIVLLSGISFFSATAQEMNTASETAKYYPEKLATDLLTLYNEEMQAPGSFLPWSNLQNMAKVSMVSKFTMEEITRERSVSYDYSKGEMKIVMEGKTSTSLVTYSIKNGVITKTMTAVREGKEKPIMKELRSADEAGRLKLVESYYHADTGWVLQSREKVSYKAFKDGLFLELRERGTDYISQDSIWYVFDTKGVLLKKSTGYNRWNFTYNEKGQIKLIEYFMRSDMGGETVYTTSYQYNKEGLPVIKNAQDKYYDTDTKLLYNAAGQLVVKTKVTRGDNEIREITSYTYDKFGHLSYLGQTVDAATTIKAKITCDTAGNIIEIDGEQFAATRKIEFKNGQGSTSSSVEGPGHIDLKVTLTPR